jgi:microbial collagenase
MCVALLGYAYTAQSGGLFRPTGYAASRPAPALARPATAPAPATPAASAQVASASRPGYVARHAQVGRRPSMEREVFGAHVQSRPLDASRRAPLQSPLSRRVDSNYDIAGLHDNVLRRPSLMRRANARNGQVSALATCDSNAFGSLSGSALVNAVKAAETSCINTLFSLTGTQAYNTFRESQMVTIANAMTSAATGYAGNNSGSLAQLVLFLRAGYYVQFYDPAVGSYGTALRNAIRPALDAFAANGNFGLVNDTHGEILSEYMILIDSATENARYLYVVKRLLNAYNTTFDAYYWMKSAVNNAYTVLWRGHQNADFVTLVNSDNTIIDTLHGFVIRNFAKLGGSDDYLVANAGREMARFLQYTGALKTVTQQRSKDLIDRSTIPGPTAKLWMGVGEMIDWHDKANCSYYNLCDFQARVNAAVLPISHTCSPTLKIRAQSMTATELANTCSIVAGEENYFHQQVQTNRTPVANDNNAALEMVIFDSSTDYASYAGTLYGIDTNNGGMYLEGDPSAAGNQARFIAYEAEWLRPTFEIWNLTHEYIHYLDGRFDMYGDFSAAMTQKTVWWVEGFAEYMSYSYRNLVYTAAVNEAAAGTYKLSQVFQNDYNSGTVRVYRWGYLGVRYMFEKRRSDVSTILGYFRPGNYTGYASFMNSIATRDDAAFKAWLPCVVNPANPGCSTAANKAPVATFGYTVSGLKANFTDGSSDPDGTIVARSWTFGDGTTSTATHPSKTYASAGSYTVSLTVTDDKGARTTTSRTVTVAFPECTATDTRVLDRNCSRSNLTASQGSIKYFYIYVPSGVSITSTGGTGNADLYVNTLGNWASPTSHNYRSTTSGNNETLVINNPPVGYVYVSLHAATAFSGVRLSVQY